MEILNLQCSKKSNFMKTQTLQLELEKNVIEIWSYRLNREKKLYEDLT